MENKIKYEEKIDLYRKGRLYPIIKLPRWFIKIVGDINDKAHLSYDIENLKIIVQFKQVKV